MNDDEKTYGDFLSRQHQRVEESWKVHSPIVTLGNLVLLIVTSAALAWNTQLGIFAMILLLCGLVGYLWLTGYVMDKTKYLQRRSSRLVQMTQAIPMFHQYSLAAAIDSRIKAVMLKKGLGDAFDDSAIQAMDDIVQRELDWFSSYATGNTDLSLDELRDVPPND